MLNMQNAYLNSEFNKKIYMKVSENINAGSSKIFLLLKSLYELKQSVNLWNKRIFSILQILDFESLTAESSIFIDKKNVIIALYVDDLLIFSKNKSDIEQIKKQIKSAHIMKNMRKVLKILSIHVTRFNEFVQIDQNHYIQQIFMKFSMKNTKSAFTLMNNSIRLDDKISKVLS